MKVLTLLFSVLFITSTAVSFEYNGGEEKEKKSGKELVLNVKGMMCGACETKAKNEIKALKGVEKVEASHAENIVRIMLASEHADYEEIYEAVKRAGFEVIRDDEKKEDKKERKKDKERDGEY